MHDGFSKEQKIKIKRFIDARLSLTKHIIFFLETKKRCLQ